MKLSGAGIAISGFAWTALPARAQEKKRIAIAHPDRAADYYRGFRSSRRHADGRDRQGHPGQRRTATRRVARRIGVGTPGRPRARLHADPTGHLCLQRCRTDRARQCDAGDDGHSRDGDGRQPSGAGRASIDAGSKSLSTDLDPAMARRDAYPGMGLIVNGPGWVIERMSEEHGWLRWHGAGEPTALPVGMRLEIFPNHVCMVFAMLRRASIMRDGMVVERWDGFGPGASE
ncbi:hypothetical protein G5V57_17525 [Nordella sp. HKS 07]|uniref:hypothetical protein n=1 Tax=Nordella sp. HKS 07 TaxID=2712222 RepID=UPI0013E1DF6B|nr:hypothetical protein [Nordella sp. HKS 07]QIG49365.1 hypothetical protein G5V57_17525 [Nordella sp. HKS 07]